MCGFVGYVGIRLPTPILEAGRDLLTHRGPDSAGLWEEIAGDFAVGLGFRRLRIIDLSPAADQPMRLGDLHLVFNGEIYNFRELRQELEGKGYSFRSTGDTEVLLAAFHEWGTEAIRRLEGMFAFAIWDRTHKRPSGDKASVLRLPRGAIRLRFGAQGAHGRGRDPTRGR